MAIIKKIDQLRHPTLPIVLQILSHTLFEKVPNERIGPWLNMDGFTFISRWTPHEYP
ncbi:hypothetical protein COMA2_10258 [Candidatus Nitrospira nitrificans]|uniref:Uncharacterized protein n=1 Tax=Candidatus Nitrospira nitrificans TaxID=1742973 RepID=A0A0S4L746_9BACT|nr:hypothetical protein COMA2_10258 [Candidatus Nitrospira nitrificans]